MAKPGSMKLAEVLQGVLRQQRWVSASSHFSVSFFPATTWTPKWQEIRQLKNRESICAFEPTVRQKWALHCGIGHEPQMN
jgi:hypothetical protein